MLSRYKMEFNAIQFKGDNLEEILEAVPSITTARVDMVERKTRSGKIWEEPVLVALTEICGERRFLEGEYLIVFPSGAIEPLHHEAICQLAEEV